jgi:hypothetical protein
MAIGLVGHGDASVTSSRTRFLIGIGGFVLLAVVALVVLVLLLSGVTLAADATALANVKVQTFGGKIESVSAYAPGRRRIPIAVRDGRLTPLVHLKPGEQISVQVAVRRPGWLSWALGKVRHEQLTLQTPVAQVKEPWLTVVPGANVNVSFDSGVSTVAYGSAGHLAHHPLGAPATSVSLGRRGATGALEIAAAARTWERVGTPTLVSWFPPAHSTVMVSVPAAGANLAPTGTIDLTFSKPVSQIFGSSRPSISPSTQGHWDEPDSHTLTFTPSGYGAPFGTHLKVQLPHSVAVTTGSSSALHTTRQLEWTVPVGSTLRLQQLLAEDGYLPVDWRASGKTVAHTPAAEARAATEPPKGSFSWRYPNTPHQLVAMWTPGQENVITKGAVMKFENTHEMTADGVAGAQVWHELLKDTIARKKLTSGYTYVYVRREIPEVLTLWHDGKTVLTTAANTGISGAETALGTYPVFEHIPEGTMSGENPDGSKYKDPGIKWISYFNGGDALHNFDRASFGTPQSLGCVELPLAASAAVYPYTPIGTLVTIET